MESPVTYPYTETSSGRHSLQSDINFLKHIGLDMEEVKTIIDKVDTQNLWFAWHKNRDRDRRRSRKGSPSGLWPTLTPDQELLKSNKNRH